MAVGVCRFCAHTTWYVTTRGRAIRRKIPKRARKWPVGRGQGGGDGGDGGDGGPGRAGTVEPGRGPGT
ncbi:hypothetical protein FF041_14670 [Streptomyces jumonjinensis]|uniref:Uncharacterized protein n=1 Tax=Streptomyces jumonjinensis TaxID=1945 RepID=A0A646KH65_STRJU|nr:hypothetical protein [Streptomyces jumonjinensis]